MFEIYSFCRRSTTSPTTAGRARPRRSSSREWRADVECALCGRRGAAARAGSPARAHFGLRREDFLAVIDGMEMDVLADIRAPDLATLDLYCDRVASAVGRLSVRVFGMDGARRALRSRIISAARCSSPTSCAISTRMPTIGRLYLPREALERGRHHDHRPGAAWWQARDLDKACARARRARAQHFGEAEAIMRDCPRAVVRAPRIMGIAYRSILDGLVARGWSPPPREPRPHPPHPPRLAHPAPRIPVMSTHRHACDRRRAGRALRRCRARAQPDARSSCTRRPRRPAGAAAPTTITRSAW